MGVEPSLLLGVESLLLISFLESRVRLASPLTSLLFGVSNYEFIQNILNSFIGKFFVVGITWSFSFQILSEIRQLFWDFGYGFELTTSKITGLIVIIGSFILTVLIYFFGRQIL